MKRPTLVIVIALLMGAGAGSVRAQSPPDSLVYAVSTLAPPEVTIPPILLQDGKLHALMVELASGAGLDEAGRRLELDSGERTRLVGLMEVEGLGRLTAEGWQPLALALDAALTDTLTEGARSLAEAIADTVDARWAMIDSLVAGLPTAGRLPLEQTGFVLLGDYLLGRMQAEMFWQAGFGPSERPFAYRVYRTALQQAPPGHSAGPPGSGGFRIVSYAPTTAPFGLALLDDPGGAITRALAPLPGDREALRSEVLEAYRVWYLFGTPPGASARRVLSRLEAVDGEGRLRVPLITPGDLEAMRSAAGGIADALWPRFQQELGWIARTADRLGYGEPELLGEVALWTWEMAATLALRELIDRGRLLPPPSGRGQSVLVPLAAHEPR